MTGPKHRPYFRRSNRSTSGKSRRSRRRPSRREPKPKLTVEMIRGWAQAHRRRTGAWPTKYSGALVDVERESWSSIDDALRRGFRGLPGGSSIARLGGSPRSVPFVRPARLTARQIIAWADAYHATHGRWPTSNSGAISGAPGETWQRINSALCHGLRGLRRGSSLRELIRRARGFRFSAGGRRLLTYKYILALVDAFHTAHGGWPQLHSGPVGGAPAETWRRIDTALRLGLRGLPKGSSLSQLLRTERGIGTSGRPLLNVTRILGWADAYYKAHGVWPVPSSEAVGGASGEKWIDIERTLREGNRGLPGGSSLRDLLFKYRGVRHRTLPLSEEQILHWARAHQRKTGKWPNSRSGAVIDAKGESWKAIDAALNIGNRGLRAGLSIAKLLKSRGITRSGAR